MIDHTQLTIIPATTAHAQDLHALFTAANAYKVERGDMSWEPGFMKRGVDWMISLGTTYVAMLDGELIGTVDVKWEDKEGWDELEQGDAGYIGRLAVKESHHGHNIGEQLMNWAAVQTRQNDCTYLRLDCAADNVSLCNYYAQNSFTLVRTKQFPEHKTPTALFQRTV